VALEQEVGMDRADRSMKAALEAEMKAKGQTGAIRQLQLCFARIMRGELAVTVQCIRMNMAEDIRRRELQAMTAAGDAQMKSAAFRELRAIMVRLAKGETAMRLEIWRSNKKLAFMQAADELKRKLQSGMQGAAMRQIRSMMVRIAKGEMAMNVDNWKMNVEIARMKASAATEARQDLMKEIQLLRARNRALMNEMVELTTKPSGSRGRAGSPTKGRAGSPIKGRRGQ